MFLGLLNVKDDQIFSHVWSPSSDRTEKHRGVEGRGEFLTRQFLGVSLAASPDAFSEDV